MKENLNHGSITSFRKLSKSIQDDLILNELFDNQKKTRLEGGKSTVSNIEMYAACRVFCLHIKLNELDCDHTIKYTTNFGDEVTAKTKIVLVVHDGIFGVQIN